MLLATIAAYTLSVPSVAAPPPARAVIGPEWRGAAHVQLNQDLIFRRGNRGQTTDVYVEGDARAVYVAFACKQTEPITAEQHNDNNGVDGDDHVRVRLWPGGPTGVSYAFGSNPIGVHDESSSENTAFAPTWTSVGARTADGYVVVMRIPRVALHGDGRKDWPIQLIRFVQRDGLNLVWAYDPAESYPGDPQYAGLARNIGAGAAASRPRARFQPYLLTQTNARAVDGAASRMGMDFSVPLTGQTSIYGTMHPDYSEVERDQQTISPSEFAYRYSEVRPFFTQGSKYFDQTTLYTPAIPTPRYGYAVEGTQSNFTFAAFNAVGHEGRDDNAAAVSWNTPDARYGGAAQRVSVLTPGFIDTATWASAGVGNGKHFTVFGSFAKDAGTNVTDPSQARFDNYGFNIYGPNRNFFFARSDYGSQFAPADSYVSFLDAHGYQGSTFDQIAFSGPNAKWESMYVSLYGDRYRNSAGQVNQTDVYSEASFRSKRHLTVNLNFDTTRGLDPNRGMVPYDSSGIYVYDGANPARSAGFGYFAGHFYNGYLRSVSPSVSIKVRPQETVSAYETRYVYTSALTPVEVQRLDTLSYAYQYSKQGSLAVGARWISGSQAYFFPLPAVHEMNLTFAVNQRLEHWHAYFVYGDPNARNTTHSMIFKLVRFVGADEGT